MYITGNLYELGLLIRYCEKIRLEGNCAYCPFADFLSNPSDPNECLAPLEDILVCKDETQEEVE